MCDSFPHKRLPSEIKLTLSFWLLIFSLITYLNHYFPYRATTDEPVKWYPVFELLNSDSIDQAFYAAGWYFQLLTGILFKMMRLAPEARQWLSPLIGTILLAIIFLILHKTFYLFGDYPSWVHITSYFTFFIFAGVVNRIIETGHKKYTTFLLFLLIYLLIITLIKDDRRVRGIAILIGCTIAMFNFTWGSFYAGLGVILGIVPIGLYTYTVDKNSKKKLYHIFYISLSIFLFSRILPKLLPSVRFHNKRVAGFASEILQPSSSVVQTSSSGASRVDRWSELVVGNVTIHTWIIWSVGIFLLFLLSVFVVATILQKLITSREIRQWECVVISINLFFGIAILFLLIDRDLATIRRISFIVSSFNVIYFTQLLAKGTIGGFRFDRDKAMGTLIVLLIISSVLATPRAMPDDNLSLVETPLDNYVSEGELNKIHYLNSYDYKQDACIYITDANIDPPLRKGRRGIPIISAGQIILHTRTVFIGPDNPLDHKVYSNGEFGELNCVSN